MKQSVKKRVLSLAMSAALLAGMVGTASAAGSSDVPLFSDVPGLELRQATEGLYQAGIINGVGDNTFAPTASMSWAELATILGRAMKVDTSTVTIPGSLNIVDDGWSSAYLAWAVESGLILPEAAFGQYEIVTQEQANQVFLRCNQIFNTQINLYPAPAGEAKRGTVALRVAGAFTYEKTAPVTVTGGQIAGYISPESGVEIYKAIPYAAPPLGELRWKGPQPVQPWDGVLSCINWSASAPQDPQSASPMWSEEFIIEDTGHSEDCLYLNVWTSGSDVKNKPVLVYIHGGALSAGGASCEVYDGEYIAQQDVVYVSIHYRLGILGYMASSALSAESGQGTSGNYGLLDQIAALKWIQDNIAAFGGDAGNVTIMGQSAGALSVHALISSPLAAGLFNKAVTNSGNNIYAPAAKSTPLEEMEKKYDELLAGYTLEQLRAMPVDELMAIDNNADLCLGGLGHPVSYAEVIRTGKANKIDLMSGMILGDTGLYGLVRGFGIKTEEDYKQLLKNTFGSQDLADRAFALYPAATAEEISGALEQINLDNMMALQNILARARIQGNDGSTYSWMFEWPMPGSMFNAFHTYDVPYFLNVLSERKAEYWTDTDRQVAQTVSGYLLNFVRTGDPNGDGLPQWNVSDGTGHYQTLNAVCGDRSISAEKMELFAEFYSDLLGG